MNEESISASDARRRFGELLDTVVAHGGEVVIERRGMPVAVVLPIDTYRQWQRQRDVARDRLFESARQSAARANLSPHEADELAAQAVAEVRAARRSRARPEKNMDGTR